MSNTGDDQPKTVSISFSVPEEDVQRHLLNPPMTRVYGKFYNNPNKEVLLFTFDPSEMRNPFQEREFVDKTEDQVREIRKARSGLSQEVSQIALFHPISAQETSVATILRAAILEHVEFKNSHVVKRNTTHVLQVEFLQMRGHKLFLFDFCPNQFIPKLEAGEFIGFSFYEAMSLIESRRVKQVK
ncbi:MAG: hypothetical protein HOL80_03095 [Candidatus Magasanikbacteria bacterium]|nr:hypothetical protein [Candidatus Magasanikbacteria bacterium]MBT5262856.1 hypothetical protein [Candidatus Magasanikbacteria bacterium]MBT5820150.1 hypothetical protein [Candidatus Magasanikbacteria bacterium]MBT6294921.1 hypothetical protein [Candidatus Magasanikbacteria bacterium]